MPPTPAPVPLTLLRTSVRALRLPGHALRRPAAPVDFDETPRELRVRLAGGLAGALLRGPVGAGLAAPMTGLGLRIVVTAIDDQVSALFNPVIEEATGPEEAGPEGNLCLPDVRAEVRRPRSVTVSWQTLNGKPRTQTFHDWHARVLQHEIEILDGRLFLDHEGAQPIGTTVLADARAEQALAALYAEEPPTPRRIEPVAVATFDPDAWALDPIVVRGTAHPVGPELHPNLVRALAAGLLREQYERGGVGLAAPQVGLGIRMAAIDDRVNPPILLRDPEIVDRSDETAVVPEGCLSLPGWRADVERPAAVKVRNHSLEGEPVDLELDGYLARIAQHEIDHLDGVLFTDRATPDTTLTPVAGPAAAEQALASILADAGEAPPKAGKRRR
ncbi:peptide deformylase [Solirubrobacter phytolaccae]|uniref:Peptide deformylase n=1 Tax=Solirubrobacter phytolaccae TaxID=1404360 RepID=A0A9X3NG81_9ACTN|nr:peptide deformylase [Solirubrobacter phytolaccae]MDA0185654.1 peptide deformylase [Solirubrobacter phytolaccae]